MAVPNNILQNVRTYQMADMAWMLNSFVGIGMANKKFKNFNDKTANLGDTVTFELTTRQVGAAGLVITQQPVQQRLQTLSCTQSFNVATAFSSQQLIFNIDEYLPQIESSGAKELGTAVESDILKNFVSGVVGMDPASSNFNVRDINSGPYRFYGDGRNVLNSYTQLAQMIANFDDYGAAGGQKMGVLPTVTIPAIIGTGLTQFAPSRNNEIAGSWMLGEFADSMWSKSNLLPVHIAGVVGNAVSAADRILTVVSTNDPSGANVTQITCTDNTGGSYAKAVRAGDLAQFNDGVSGFENMRFLTFIGHKPCAQPVQFLVTADADCVSGTVVLNVRAAAGAGLVWAQNSNQNLNQPIQAGMKLTPLPTHRAGCLMSGSPLYLAMPRLPDQPPYGTVTDIDSDSGISIRHYYGSQFGQNVTSYVKDCLWGSTLVAENSMRIILPV